MWCLRNLSPVLMQVLVKYYENAPTILATCNAVELTAALLMYASSLFRNNGWRNSGNIPRHDPCEGGVSVEDELAVFFISMTSGEGDLAAINLLVGALEELGAIVFYEERFKWHLSVFPICFTCITSNRVAEPSLCFVLSFRAMAWKFHSNFCLCDSLFFSFHRLIVYSRPFRPGTTMPQTLQS